VQDHEDEVVGDKGHYEELDDLAVGGESLEPHARARQVEPEAHVSRVDQEVVDEHVLDRSFLHVLPVILLPGLLLIGLDLKFLVGFGAKISGQVKQGEEEQGSDEDAVGDCQLK
jgi:hypothetical protein